MIKTKPTSHYNLQVSINYCNHFSLKIIIKIDTKYISNILLYHLAIDVIA